MRGVVATVAAVACLVGAGGVIVVAERGDHAPRRQEALAVTPVTEAVPAAVIPAPTTTTTAAPAPPAPAVAPWTATATPHGTIPVFSSPGGPEVSTTGSWYGWPLTLPVLTGQDGYVEVRLPLRPNGSTGWVRQSDVTMGTTPFHIVVHLSPPAVFVYENGQQVMAFPAGIGVPATPTPTGNFFVAVKEPHPPPGYGPVILDTSAHSEAIQSWEGSGDAVIALHGPITSWADSQIGATGTRISNGCIRLHDWDLAKLEQIPLGTPVDITA